MFDIEIEKGKKEKGILIVPSRIPASTGKVVKCAVLVQASIYATVARRMLSKRIEACFIKECLYRFLAKSPCSWVWFVTS